VTRPLRPTALVTGGNRGIGKAIAAGLKARGCAVTIGARNADEGRAAAAEIGCAFALYDLFAAHRGFDILVNNAGILKHVSLLSPRSDFTRAMEVMVAAPLDLIRMNASH
jgi:NAD(P)-dependent dehydrogenase (short-subunit alcohol dehydrogenase family)